MARTNYKLIELGQVALCSVIIIVRVEIIYHGEIRMYIDPSAGGLIFQALAVLFGFASGAILLFSGRIKMGIARGKRWWREKNQAVKESGEGNTDSARTEN